MLDNINNKTDAQIRNPFVFIKTEKSSFHAAVDELLLFYKTNEAESGKRVKILQNES
jgi:hypothetical protein